MPSTFVPDEALPPPHPLRGDPTTRHSKAPARRSEFLSTSQIRYDLFRSRHEPELYCALPEDWPTRAFIQSDQWQVAGRIDEADPMPLGFAREAARIGMRLNGFYLFVAFSPISGLRSDSVDCSALRPVCKARTQSMDGMLSPLESRKDLSLHQSSQGS